MTKVATVENIMKGTVLKEGVWWSCLEEEVVCCCSWLEDMIVDGYEFRERREQKEIKKWIARKTMRFFSKGMEATVM